MPISIKINQRRLEQYVVRIIEMKTIDDLNAHLGFFLHDGKNYLDDQTAYAYIMNLPQWKLYQIIDNIWLGLEKYRAEVDDQVPPVFVEFLETMK